MLLLLPNGERKRSCVAKITVGKHLVTRLSDAQRFFANGERNQMNEANFTVGKRIIVHGSVTLKDADKTEAQVRLLLVLCIFRVGDHAWRGGTNYGSLARQTVRGKT